MENVKNIKKIIEALRKESVEFTIIGGIAVIIYGVDRATFDIDVLISTNKNNVINTIHAIKKLNMPIRLT